jgi:hypothetical protein
MAVRLARTLFFVRTVRADQERNAESDGPMFADGQLYLNAVEFQILTSEVRIAAHCKLYWIPQIKKIKK